MSFCSLIKEVTPKIRMLCFVLINSVLLNLLCVWKCCIITTFSDLIAPFPGISFNACVEFQVCAAGWFGCVKFSAWSCRERERDRQTDRQTDTDRDRDRQTVRQTQRQRERETETDRQRQRETETQTDRQTDRQTTGVR